MKKALPIILVGVVVLGAGAYFFSQNKGQQPAVQIQEEEQTEGQESSGQQEAITGSLKEMLGLGRSLKCSWSNDGGSGTTWVKNDMFYNEVTSEGQQARVIFKDDCMWSWQEGRTQGAKMCFSPEEAEEIISGESEDSEAADTEASIPTDVEYSCQPANISDAKFDLPENVQFMDVGEFMQGMGE